jgi:hypothetical protein
MKNTTKQIILTAFAIGSIMTAIICSESENDVVVISTGVFAGIVASFSIWKLWLGVKL